MKIIKLFTVLLMVMSIVSCSQDEQAIDEVFDTVTRGAVLRTTQTISGALNVVDPSSIWSIEIEAQDVDGGALMSEVRIYANLVDNTDDATTVTSETQLGTVSASEFSTGPFGLPRKTITYSLGELASALGITFGEYNCGDFFRIRLELELTDGRTFTSNQASGTISQSFYSSPFQYVPALIALLPDDNAFSGQYMLTQTVPGIFGVSDYVDGVYTVESVSNTIKVIKDIPTFPAFGPFGPVDVEFQLICGEIILTGGQSVGAGCGGGAIENGPANVNATYDIVTPDDSDFVIDFTSSENGNCTSGVQAQIRLVKM